MSFDAAWDPVLWMVDGHELHLVDDLTRRDPYALRDYLIRERIDVIETTPTFFDQLWATGLFEGPPEQRPRVVALGGEAVTEARWQALRRLTDSLVLNLYGPTECTVDSVLAAVSDHLSPVIGRPVQNTRAYVLDEDRRPSTVGERPRASCPAGRWPTSRPS